MTPPASLPRCPLCGAAVDRQKTKSFPFCTPRCQQIDLGRWLGESYELPGPEFPAAGHAYGEDDE